MRLAVTLLFVMLAAGCAAPEAEQPAPASLELRERFVNDGRLPAQFRLEVRYFQPDVRLEDQDGPIHRSETFELLPGSERTLSWLLPGDRDYWVASSIGESPDLGILFGIHMASEVHVDPSTCAPGQFWWGEFYGHWDGDEWGGGGAPDGKPTGCTTA